MARRRNNNYNNFLPPGYGGGYGSGGYGGRPNYYPPNYGPTPPGMNKNDDGKKNKILSPKFKRALRNCKGLKGCDWGKCLAYHTGKLPKWAEDCFKQKNENEKNEKNENNKNENNEKENIEDKIRKIIEKRMEERIGGENG